jgi:FkbM family methyltransferase
MNATLQTCLTALSKADYASAYVALTNEPVEPEDHGLAEQLKFLITAHFYRQRATKLGSLNNLKKTGFNPSLVIDVGAQVGTPELFNIFPDAHHLLVEPVVECLPTLHALAARLASAEVVNAAVSDSVGSARLSVTPSRQYASIEQVLGEESREVKVVTVDSLCAERQFVGTVLLKIDVDGVEVKALMGAQATLQGDCVVVVEASIGDDLPRFNRVVECMSGFGFDVYDVVDVMYRNSDWHMSAPGCVDLQVSAPVP